jgi:hypothetical protein
MSSSGVFVVLSDEASLTLYLHQGLYGFLMSPVHRGAISPQSRHFQALADYACVRDGTHVFFFLKRHIVYGGQVVGHADYGSFYLNGPLSPLGLAAGATLCWDESGRARYSPTSEAGVFRVPLADGPEEKCQPYLIRFQDALQLRGNAISSDELYWRLGDYGYPLPSNSIQGMSFCTLTPRETDIAIELLSTQPKRQFSWDGADAPDLLGDPVEFRTEFGVRNLVDGFVAGFFVNEAHLEASVIANPALLPEIMRPQAGDCICRQVPVSPFKPAQMDRADICYFSGDAINDGTIPNVVIELKNKHANQSAVDQVVRYVRWFHRIAEDQARSIRAYVFAPSFAKNVRVADFRDQIELMTPFGALKK